ncbi:MAG TPA: outer membrane beta-barrel protein [Bryobacteraceae bacterium]|nr:outer membrane beta-barrel protein [Bryobacteraceae bacterium]
MDIKLTHVLVVAGALAAAPAALAQKWEFGGGAGRSFSPGNDVTNGGATATVKTQSNVAAGVWLANNIGNHWGGEVRLDYSRGDLQLSSGGTQAAFNSEAYAMHYDFQWHFTPASSKVRPFVAAGGGVKYYRGIGTEVELQPLSQFALLTKTTQLKPMASGGAGVKFQITPKFGFRVEVHDFVTPFPKDVVQPNTGSKISGWMQDIVAMGGISYLF